MNLYGSAGMLAASCFGMLSGCGGGAEAYDTVAVTGVATCEGKPIADATINFTPASGEGRASGRPGRPALGVTDANGRFTLSTYAEGDGVIPGTHVVTISLNSHSDSGPDPNKNFACAKSSKDVTVEPGTTEVNVDF